MPDSQRLSERCAEQPPDGAPSLPKVRATLRVDLPDAASDAASLRAAAANLPSLQLTARQVGDLEMVAAGLNWPLWLVVDESLALRNPRNELLGIIEPGGGIHHLVLAPHPDFPDLRAAPDAVRARLAGLGRPNVLAVPFARPLWREDEALLADLAARLDAALLILALSDDGGLDFYARVRALRLTAERRLPPNVVRLLPALSWPAERGPALAAVARAFGATHLAWPAPQRTPERRSELDGLRVVDWPGCPFGDAALPEGQRAEVADILAQAHPPRVREGFCLWFTGLPSSGKSTVADEVVPRLREAGRSVTLLDGDVVRTHLSKGLGFSREDRDANILRIGFVAAEIVRHHGVAVCAAVSPYLATRQAVRAMVGPGRFVEIHVDTPIEVCERRDVKGLYAQARAGRIRGFTGVDDPYEAPPTPELRLATLDRTPADNAGVVLAWLREAGFLPGECA
jgi:sulfate adenylyltransferase